MPKSLTDTLDDADFRKLSPDAQKIVLGKMGVSEGMQGKLLEKISASPAAQSYDQYLSSGEPTQQARPKPVSGMEDAANTLIKEPLKNLAKVSSLNQGYQFLRKNQFLRKKFPSLDAGEGLGKPTPDEILTTGLMSMIPEGEEAASEGGAARRAVAEPARVKSGLPEPPLPPEAQAKFTSSIDKANKDYAAGSADYAKKVGDAAAERKRGFQGDPGGPKFEAEKAANRKEALTRGSKEYTKLAHENLQQTYSTARGSLDQHWGKFRESMEGTQLDPLKAFDTIEAAKAKYLKGSPASLKVFNDLANEIGIQKVTEDGNVITPKDDLNHPTTPELDFDTGRVHYSAIGDKLAQGNLPGNVYQALKTVSKGLDEQLTEAAESRGQGKSYTALKSDEHQFRSDWTDSKSPLAKAYKAQDPNFLAGHLTGKGSDLLMKQLARYREAGARPYLTAAARRMDAEAGAIKVPKVSGPKEFSAAKPELAEVKRPVVKPETPKGNRAAHIVGRVAGKVVGGAVGSAVGHPLLGYGVGGEAGGALADRLSRRRGIPPPPE